MSRISLDTTPAKNTDQVIERVVEGEALLIHLSSGDYFSLDNVGTRVWENIDGTRTIQDLAELILMEYDVDRNQVVADVLRLAEKLADEGLLIP